MEDMFYSVADKTLTKMMTDMLKTMIEMSSDSSLERMREISESALEKAWNNILGERKKSGISREEWLAMAKEGERQPRVLTREEFFALVDEEPSLENRSMASFPERAERSLLYELGYSVAQESGLSDQYRRDLLENIIRSGQMTKGQVSNHLYYLIKINGKKGTNDIAVSKWKRDLEFVKTL